MTPRWRNTLGGTRRAVAAGPTVGFMVALRWTLLPDKRGASIHRTDPDHDGYVLCGRLVDSHTPVHAHNPGFDVCVRCAVLVGEPVSGGFRSEVADHSNGNPDAEVRAVPRADT